MGFHHEQILIETETDYLVGKTNYVALPSIPLMKIISGCLAHNGLDMIEKLNVSYYIDQDKSGENRLKTVCDLNLKRSLK